MTVVRSRYVATYMCDVSAGRIPDMHLFYIDGQEVEASSGAMANDLLFGSEDEEHHSGHDDFLRGNALHRARCYPVRMLECSSVELDHRGAKSVVCPGGGEPRRDGCCSQWNYY